MAEPEIDRYPNLAVWIIQSQGCLYFVKILF